MFRCLCALLLGGAVAHDHQTETGLEDKEVLLQLKAVADTTACRGPTWDRRHACPLDSWSATTHPCHEGWNDKHEGWFGITCEGRGNGARVLVVDLPGVGVAGELLPYFGRLGALLFLVRHSLWSAAFLTCLIGRWLACRICPTTRG